MRFRTEYIIPPSPEPLDPQKPVVLLGSCFSDNIGLRMRLGRWAAHSNPVGTLYNPESIANLLTLALCDDNIEERVGLTMAVNNGIWSSWLTDSKFSSRDRSQALQNTLTAVGALRTALRSAQALIITFGTAWVFELADRPGFIVSNCHKFPASDFVRRRLSVTQITDRWLGLAQHLRAKFPECRLIFTISPIRHLKDGFEGNARSKAVLQLATEVLVNNIGGAEYFPSYELLNDDLRDYRFYAGDLVHPSAEAVEYIWEKFCDKFLTAKSREILAEGERVTKALAHRPIASDGTPEARQARSELIEKNRQRCLDFHQRYPGTLPPEF